ncbi:MAG: glycosyltransferase family 2 protein [Bacilli bacterium]|jgi:glycosyltransferase involved in cell wall biosynthesis|nr:glycosyltransferase family 2 protein [Bacilli bacterium]
METLYLVIPCYNEELVLDETSHRLQVKMGQLIDQKKITKDSKVVFVNDGSKDKTWEKIVKLHEENSLFAGINLSRNRGHQNALLAGLMTVKEDADMVISMDADLQDDIDVIDQFVAEYYNGNDVVYGVRSSRKQDTFFKRNSALAFYRLMEKMGVQVVYNHADYRLLSKRALQALSEFKEVNLFLRGMVPLIGFSSTTVSYERKERFAGESKYPLKKMLAFAFDGITSFSIKPIRFFLFLGIFIFFCSICMLIYALVSYFRGNAIWGWTSVITSIWALGGLQLFAIGVIGEYIGKVYMESKGRPRYIIETYLK